MLLKSIFLALAVLVLGASTWKYLRAPAAQIAEPSNRLPKPIVFDNGTVREPPLPSSAPAVALRTMRKCQKGAEVVYTDNPCQKGFRELAIKGGTVTLVDTQRATSGVPQPLPRPSLHDVLDESGNANLRERRMDRAINR